MERESNTTTQDTDDGKSEALQYQIHEHVNILVVDDCAAARHTVMRLLKKCGYRHIIDAPSAKEGLNKLSSGEIDFDLVLLDWLMPGGMNGLEMLRSIKARWPSLPVIMASSVNDKEQVLLALQTGAADFLIKPFSKEMIREKIEGVFSSAESVWRKDIR